MLGAGALGGVMWAFVARLAFDTAGYLRPALFFWAVIATGCVALFSLGLAIALWVPTSVLKTAGVVIALAPLTGAVFAVFVRLLHMAF